MIVDIILDRYDDENVGIYRYDPMAFYRDMMEYEADDITRALDYGTESDVKDALCRYIDENGYSDAIKDYIREVDWLTADEHESPAAEASGVKVFEDPFAFGDDDKTMTADEFLYGLKESIKDGTFDSLDELMEYLDGLKVIA